MKRLFIYFLLLIFCSSCTYDYFEDETNYRLYVPQIHEKSITDFHISVFDKLGNLAFEREYIYPFDADIFIEQGIIKMKLPPGDYRISGFANSKNTETNLVYQKSKNINTSAIWLEAYRSNVYKTAPELRTVLNKETLVPFIGEPLKIDTLDISEKSIHVGQIIYNFKKLPNSIHRIEIATTNLATGLAFDGTSLNTSTNDCVLLHFQTDTLKTANDHFSIKKFYYPSALSNSRNGEYKILNIHTRFYDANNNLIGEYLDPLPKANDINGNPTDPILLSGKKLRITFEGFIIANIVVSEWGDIIDGEITPM